MLFRSKETPIANDKVQFSVTELERGPFLLLERSQAVRGKIIVVFKQKIFYSRLNVVIFLFGYKGEKTS